MAAGNEGAGEKSFGVGINLPSFEKTNPYIAPGEKLMSFNYFFTRKLIFVKESDATALFPGGFGTNDELYEILTLLQTGKSMPRPIVLINVPGKTYWKTWLKFIEKEMQRNGFLDADSLKLFKIVNTVDSAVNEITNFYKVYHSIRYSGPLTILRLNKGISPSKIKELNKKYKDILVSGEICSSKPCK
ncbi:MAG: LOG family protein [Candidatus Saganbacteria bacterium]|nr:LOG family protein [Candidatus Saganbacteria bacterium]